MEYALSTLDGQFQCLTINTLTKSIGRKDIKTNLNLSKHRVLGLDVSNNKGIWLIALYPNVVIIYYLLSKKFFFYYFFYFKM